MLMRNYRGPGLLGERYLLTNTSTAPLTLAEQEFDREGASVLAVAIENLNLRPGGTTWVYVIRSEGQP
jgi:conjugal transfer pilus assembly protein TraK